MLVTKARVWEMGTRKRTISREVKLGPLSMKAATIAIIALAALFYLAQSNQGSVEKYRIMQLEESKKEIEAQTKQLEVEAARLKSLNEIKKSSEGMGLESAYKK